jgi:hypothetical protein
MIISLHLPKTAGTSFFDALTRVYGDQLMRDYNDIPLNRPVEERNRKALSDALHYEQQYRDPASKVACVHGHFLPVKYGLLPCESTQFITWMRHPVERLVSHYFFWLSAYNENAAPLHKRVVEENWTLEDFAFSNEMRNVYDQFLFAFPLHKFDFIGITEHFSDDLCWFANNIIKTNGDVEEKKLNQKKTTPEISNKLRSEIETFHEQDMMLYTQALDMRKKRI